jgi:hypothetical protein
VSISWKQLAAIPDSVEKHRILKALDITPPPEGVAHSFEDKGIYITAVENGFSFMDTKHPNRKKRNTAQLFATPMEVAKACRWPVGTPTGEAIRNWLTGHGYTRPSKKPIEPNDNTKTII